MTSRQPVEKPEAPDNIVFCSCCGRTGTVSDPPRCRWRIVHRHLGWIVLGMLLAMFLIVFSQLLWCLR